MEKYILNYTGTEGAGQIGSDGSKELPHPVAIRKKGDRYSYLTQTEYPIENPTAEQQLDLYLQGRLVYHTLRMDSQTGERKELFTHHRPHPMVSGGSLRIYDGRYLCNVVTPGGEHCVPWLTDEDGTQWTPVATPDEAFIYSLNLNSTRDILTGQVTTKYQGIGAEVSEFKPHDYAINTFDLRTGKRTLIDSRPNLCLFGPTFSPDDQWILYMVGPLGHDGCFDRHMFDLCIARPDGSEQIDLTTGGAHYNRTAFGPPEHRRGGSNWPVWLDSKTILYSKRSPGAHPDCAFDSNGGDHKMDYYDPAMAKGGCQLVMLNIETREETPITPFEEGKWDFRATLSPDRQWLAYISARSGGHPSELRLCKIDGSENRFLTRGYNGLGVDHPIFVAVE